MLESKHIIADVVGYTELQKLTQLLKLTESMTLEVIPGNLIGIAAKQFDWFLTDFTQNEINIQIKFVDPTIISYD